MTNPRPPALWFSRMWSKTALQYPQNGESLDKWKERVSRVTASIWWKLPQVTKDKLLKRYDNGLQPKLLNPKAHMIECPRCNTKNPIAKAGVYLKCSHCRTPLVSVRVRK